MANIFRPPCDEAAVRSRPAGGESPTQAMWILAATILGSSMAFIDGTVVNVALPILQRELGTSASGAQWVVQAYGLCLAALLLVGGSLGDRFGRRRMFVAGIVIFTVASVACGLAQNLPEII